MIWLLLAGLVLRLGWSLSRSSDVQSLSALPDQIGYLDAGAHLRAGEGMWYLDERFGQRSYAGRTPGYPLFVAMMDAKVPVVRIAQCIIDLSTAVAVFLIARRWLDERRSLFACALVVLNPLLVYHSGMVLSDTLYTAMLAWSVCFLIQRRTLLLGLLLCSLAIYVRPSGLLMPAALAAVVPWTWRTSARAGRLYAVGAAMLIVFVVLIPWFLRNYRVLDRPFILSSNGGITLYDGVHPGATGASDQSFVEGMPELKTMDEVQRDEHFNRLSRTAIASDPLRFAGLAVVKVARTWSPIPLSDQFGSNPLYVLVGLFYSLPLLALALWGLVRSELPWRIRLLLITPAMLITLVHAVSVGSLRYRLPAEPLLAIIAASAAVSTSRPDRALEAQQS